MDNNYDFESSEPVSNGTVQNQQKNNGYTPNGYTPNNNYTPNNYSSNNGKNGGGVPLIAIIGIMALIILALIVYIVYKEVTPKEEVNVSVQTQSTVDSYVEDEKDEEDEEDEVVEETEDVEDVENKKENKDVVKDEEEEIEEDNEITTPDNDEVIETNNSNENIELSKDWKDMEFILAGNKYTLNTDYKNFIDNGWSVDFEKLGYADGYILNKNDKTYTTADLENENYEDSEINIGFINLGEKALDVTECQFWGISVDNAYADTPVDFELPAGIKNGSTLAEVEAAYGIPEDENDIYISDSLGYRVYSYNYDYEIDFEVTISDTDGVTGFEYKCY